MMKGVSFYALLATILRKAQGVIDAETNTAVDIGDEIIQLKLQLETARDQIREFEPNARRYLWLRTVAPMELTVFAWRSRAATRFDTPDEAIDAAIAERNQKGQPTGPPAGGENL